MVTADEIVGVSIFAALGTVERERLSRVAADIRLVTGEYAVHASDEPALFAVLEGRLETVALVDGIERVVGGRGVGDLVGEVPIARSGRRSRSGFALLSRRASCGSRLRTTTRSQPRRPRSG